MFGYNDTLRRLDSVGPALHAHAQSASGASASTPIVYGSADRAVQCAIPVIHHAFKPDELV
jgi:hypothetical protein